MHYAEAREYLAQTEERGNRLGLTSMRILLHELNDPQDQLRFIHIAGTNGKGSVMTYLERILLRAGYRTGRYISPVLSSYEEKIQVNGTPIGKEDLAACTGLIRDACDRIQQKGLPLPTIFEVETAIAFLHFLENRCEIVLLETGMGGAEDATNAVSTTMMCIFSSISLDHMQFLGGDIRSIATVKSGIIKPGVLSVSDVQCPAVREVLTQAAARNESEIVFLEENMIRDVRYGLYAQYFTFSGYKDLCIHIPGVHQIRNCALAVMAAERLAGMGMHISEADIRFGIAAAVWPGRFEILRESPFVIADGAHNEDAAVMLRRSIDLYFPGRRFYYIFGVFSDKEYDKIIDIMADRAFRIYAVETAGSKRALPARELTRILLKRGLDAVCAVRVETALGLALKEAGPDDVILLFGSLSWLHEARELLQ